VAGLTDRQAFTTAVPPSTLTPSTVVKHLTGTERFWFSIDFANLEVTWPWTDDDLHGNFRDRGRLCPGVRQLPTRDRGCAS
jgi:hypothetical protein